MTRFHGRTEPGRPADWNDRAAIGGRRRAPASRPAWFAIGVAAGILAQALLAR